VTYEAYIFTGIVRGIGVSIQGWWYVDDQVFVLHRLCRSPRNIKWESAFMMQSYPWFRAYLKPSYLAPPGPGVFCFMRLA